MIRTNIAEFRLGFQRWLQQQEEGALDVFRGLAATAYAYIVEETPEYTGETVANWTFHADGPDLRYTSGIKLGRKVRRQAGKASAVWQKPGATALPTILDGNGGNPAALRLARASLRQGFRSVSSLAQDIWIANATHFDPGGFQVGQLETPPSGWLREVNAPGHMIERAVSYVSDVFARIDASNVKRLMVMPA
jgi:hypothetical protein